MQPGDLLSQAEQAKYSSRTLIKLTTQQKNEALLAVARGLRSSKTEILEANARDVDRAKAAGATVMVDRLQLNDSRIEAMANAVEHVAKLEDVVGQIIDSRTRPNGLMLERVRCPLGVVGMIYESRPNVTVDAATLCLKSGNAVMLKGGSDAIESNRMLVEVMKRALEATAVPSSAIQFLDTTDRVVTTEFLQLKGFLDVIIPRGGRSLIEFVSRNATVPVIETGASVVHTYVDASADLSKSIPVIVNAKTRRVSICNALDTLLVHSSVAMELLPKLVPFLEEKEVELRCDARSLEILGGQGVPASPDDFGKEFLDHVLAIKMVDSFEEALDHIAKYSLKHSEAILTEDVSNAERFLNEVDAAVVYWNASTQFSDGEQFGLGAEIGISTQKLHVRGPFALEGLTTFKWVVRGHGQTRE